MEPLTSVTKFKLEKNSLSHLLFDPPVFPREDACSLFKDDHA
jgi:hypothetical protein